MEAWLIVEINGTVGFPVTVSGTVYANDDETFTMTFSSSGRKTTPHYLYYDSGSRGPRYSVTLSNAVGSVTVDRGSFSEPITGEIK